MLSGLLGLVCLIAGCSANPPALVGAPPTVSGDAARACTELRKHLPDDVDDRDRRDTEPASDLVAAWGGDPPVVLRCGVERPAGSVPGADLIEVNGVDWTLDQTSRAYDFTTYGRTAYIEVAVPIAVPRAEATNSLVDLATAVLRADPTV